MKEMLMKFGSHNLIICQSKTRMNTKDLFNCNTLHQLGQCMIKFLLDFGKTGKESAQFCISNGLHQDAFSIWNFLDCHQTDRVLIGRQQVQPVQPQAQLDKLASQYPIEPISLSKSDPFAGLEPKVELRRDQRRIQPTERNQHIAIPALTH